MKLTINGFRFPWPKTGLQVVVEADPEGNEVGPVSVTFRGGLVTIKAGKEARDSCLLISCEEGGDYALDASGCPAGIPLPLNFPP